MTGDILLRTLKLVPNTIIDTFIYFIVYFFINISKIVKNLNVIIKLTFKKGE